MERNLIEMLKNPAAGFQWVKIYQKLDEIEYSLRFHSQQKVAAALEMKATTFVQALKRARKEFEENGAYSAYEYAPENFKTEVNSKETKQLKKTTQPKTKTTAKEVELPPLPGALPEPKRLNFNGGD